MELTRLDHVTIQARAEELPALREFYTEVVGLTAGPRPEFAFPGYWMYLGDRAVVHLAAQVGELPPARPGETGRFDHLALRARGLAELRARLAARGVPFQEVPVPDVALHLLFACDPAGVKLEFTFDAAEAAER